MSTDSRAIPSRVGVSESRNVSSHSLSVRNVVTDFVLPSRTVRAVDDVSFEVPEGSMFGLVGETGCGKSATIRSILGLIRPPGRVVRGQAFFGQHDLLALKRGQLQTVLGKSIGFVAQNPWSSLNPVVRIDRQFDDRLRKHTALGRTERRARSLSLLETVEIRDPKRVLNGYAHELSGGMAQRVVIALALSCEPTLVVADEPTTALDLTVQAEILDLLADLAVQRGFSTLIVTHDLGVVAQYCGSVAVMYAGKIVENGRTVDVLESPAHPYTKGLLAAIPRAGKRLVFMSGRVPDLSAPRTGCSFAPRCQWAVDLCRSAEPPLEIDDVGRASACHRTDELKAVR